MKTLIVEDDFTSRLLMHALLAPYGECHVAVNGREAVEAFGAARGAGEPYDLVCLDIMMPEMDGHEVLRQLRAAEEAAGELPSAGVKVLMTTALDDPKTVLRAFGGLCDAYLVKPVDKTQLLRRVESLGLLR